MLSYNHFVSFFDRQCNWIAANWNGSSVNITWRERVSHIKISRNVSSASVAWMRREREKLLISVMKGTVMCKYNSISFFSFPLSLHPPTNNNSTTQQRPPLSLTRHSDWYIGYFKWNMIYVSLSLLLLFSLSRSTGISFIFSELLCSCCCCLVFNSSSIYTYSHERERKWNSCRSFSSR